MTKREFTLSNEGELVQVTDFILEILNDSPAKETGVVIALSGELGAGKTTFTKLLAQNLGVKENLTSPTFVILKKYQILNPEFNTRFNNLIHIDAYRLNDADELRKLSFDSFYANTEERNIICIEWPEMVSGIIPENAIYMRFEHQDDATRKVTVKADL